MTDIKANNSNIGNINKEGAIQDLTTNQFSNFTSSLKKSDSVYDNDQENITDNSKKNNNKQNPYRWVILILYSFLVLVFYGFIYFIVPVTDAIIYGFDTSNFEILLFFIPGNLTTMFY